MIILFVSIMTIILGIIIGISLYNYYLDNFIFRIEIKQNKMSLDVINYFKNTKVLNWGTKKLVNSLTITNAKSFEDNYRYAAWIIIIFSITLPLMCIILTIKMKVWYLVFSYLIIYIMTFALIILGFASYAKTRFSAFLPILFKITDERVSKHKNILSVLEISKNDLKKPLQKQVQRIIDILKQNDREKVGELFNELSQIYDNDIFVIYLILVEKACFNGINEEVIEQFGIQARQVEIKNTYAKNIKSKINVWILVFVIIVFSMLYFINPMSLKMLKQLIGDIPDSNTLQHNLIYLSIFIMLTFSSIVMTTLKRIE